MNAIRAALALFVLSAWSGAASGADCTWTGASSTSDNWSDPANWNNCAGAHPIPITNDTLVFPSAAGRKSTSFNDLASLNVLSVQVNGLGYLISGNALTFSIMTCTLPPPGAEPDSVLALDLVLGIAPIINVPANGTLTFSGSLSGVGFAGVAFNKNGAGTLVLSGSNTYSGLTNINAGVLNLRSNTALGNASSGTTVADGAQLQVQGGITVASEALTLNNHPTGALRNVSGSNTWAGPITLTNTSIGGDETLTLAGPIGGTGLTKIGAGDVILSGTNTYTGITTVDVGVLLGNGDGSFGASGPGNGTVVNSGATLQLAGSLTVAGEPLILNGSGITGAGALQNLSGDNTWTGAITLSSAGIGVGVDDTLTLSGPMDGSGLTKVGPGTLTLSGNNTPTGSVTFVIDGALQVESNTALGATGAANGTVVQNGAQLILGAGATAVAETLNLSGTGISGTGAVRSTSGSHVLSGPITLDADTTMAPEVQQITVTGTIGGTASLTKIGAGTLNLNAANTYTGSTFVNEGILRVGGSVSTVVVFGGSLVGFGSVGAVTLNAGGVVAPGRLPARLSIGSMTWNGGGALQLEVDSNNDPLFSDRLVLSGALTKGSGSGFLVHFFDAATPPEPGVIYPVATYSGTNFVDADFSHTYNGQSNSMLGEFIAGLTQLEFVPTQVSLFRDGFE